MLWPWRATGLRTSRQRCPASYVIPTGPTSPSPTAGRPSKLAIRNRVLNTIQSTWGGRRDAHRHAACRQRHDPDRHLDLRRLGRRPGAGRGAEPWRERAGGGGQDGQQGPRRLAASCKNASAADLYRPGLPEHRATRVSFARQCRGSCRGRAGRRTRSTSCSTRSAPDHARHVTVQTSMNLTTLAYQGQWNQAQVVHSAAVYHDFLGSSGRPASGDRSRSPTTCGSSAAVVDYFFPRPGCRPASGPGDADPQRRELHGATARRHRPRTHPDPDHPVRHVRRPRRLDRQEAALPVERTAATSGSSTREPAARCCSILRNRSRPRADPDAAVGDQGQLRRRS